MLTVWCLTVAFLTPWATGGPVLWLVRGCQPLRRSDWLWAPFLGLAALVGTLQPLIVFADVPLVLSTPWFVTGVATGWIVLLLSRSGRASLCRFPVRVAAISLSVYLALGLGVLLQGVERYRGNMQSDQYQYVALAQFLIEERYSTDWPDLGQRPWLVQPVALKADRLGQSVIHGFLAAVAGRRALDLYFPAQLLGAALLCPAMFLLATQFRLNRRLATAAAVAAALAPGTVTLQNLCFLSQVLCVPALIAFLAAAIRLGRGGGLRPLPYAGATFALALAVYTEFAPLFLGVAGAALGTGWVIGSIRLRRMGAAAAALAAAVAVSPAAAAGAVSVWHRSVENGNRITIGGSVPLWAAGLWVNSSSAYRLSASADATGIRVLTYGSFALAATGAGLSAGSALRRNRGALPAVVGAASLLVPPVFLWVIQPGSVYLICKLMWTLTPVLVLFAACALRTLGEVAARSGISGPGAKRLAAAGLGSLAAIWVFQGTVEQRAYLEPGDIRTRPARAWNDPALAELCAVLRDRPPADVLVALGSGSGPPSTEVAALCYHGRRHRIWIASPHRVWWTRLEDVPAAQLTDLDTVPSRALVVLPRGTAPPAAGEIVFHNDRYEVVTFATGDRGWVAGLPFAVGHANRRP